MVGVNRSALSLAVSVLIFLLGIVVPPVSFAASAGIDWVTEVSAADNSWNSVTYGNGLFVAVSYTGSGNRVMTSPDGITWTSRSSAADYFWSSVTYGNGLFVAVSTTGTGNRVMTSPDGITWTSRSSVADNSWYSVTYGNGLFVAVSSTGTGNRVMTSPDGITWTSRSSAADNPWRAVTYGNGLFVAVSTTGSGNRVMTSPDGITWTSRSSAADNSWNSVTYGNGLFAAVSISGAGNRVMISFNSAPTVSSVLPSSGTTAGSTAITITGTGFLAGATATVGGVTCSSPTVVLATSITCTTGAHAAGAVNVVVTNTDAQTGTGTNAYTYVVPATAPAAATNTASAITATGATLNGTVNDNGAATTVTFGYGLTNSYGSIANASPGSVAAGAGATTVTGTLTGLTCNTTYHYQVSATNSVNTTDGGDAIFTTSACPVSAYAPADLIPSGLNPGDQFYVVFTSSSDQGAASSNIATYNALVQGLAAASSIAGVQSISAGFNVIGATSTYNQCQPADPAKPVYSVTKTRISSTVSAMFTPSAVSLNSPLDINESGQAVTNGIAYTGCNTDGTPLTSYELGEPNVAIGLTNVTNDQWLYYGASYPNNASKALYAISPLLTVAAPPTVAATNPVTGPVAGGTVITISGTHFMNATVAVGGINCPVSSQSATSITCTTGPHVLGTVAVVVTNSDNQSATSAGAFTYVAMPTVSGISPSSGPVAGGTTVTITGTYLTGATALTFGGTAATSFTVNSATQITAAAPSGPAGAANVVVTTAGGSVTSTGGYTYLLTPTLSISNSPQTYTGSGLAATVSCLGGGTVSDIKYNSNSTLPTAAGTYAITANCAASGNYAAVTGASAGNFVISTASQSINLVATPSAIAVQGASTLSVTGTLGTGAITYALVSGPCSLPASTAVLTGTGAGTCAVTASIAADPNYAAATSSPINVTVSGPPQVTNVRAVPDAGFIKVVFDVVTGASAASMVRTQTAVMYTATCTSSDGGITASASGPGSPLDVTGTTPGKSYRCTVTGTDGSGSSTSDSSNVVTSLPGPPAPNPIPTLPEWAQIIMVLMMILAPSRYGRRMKPRY